MNEPFIENCEIEQSVNIFKQVEDCTLLETLPLAFQIIPEEQTLLTTITQKSSKSEIRLSLSALTFEGLFATTFYNIVGGVLLSNFLLELGAKSVEIGMLASISGLTNLLQPLGAYIADRTTSRHWYSLFIFGPSRLLWLSLVPAIWLVSSSRMSGHQLVQLTLIIICLTNILEAFGRASFASWVAELVPEKLRGRYFGFRNTVLILAGFISMPLLSLAVSKWPSGSLQGYGVLIVLAIVLGCSSLVCQFFMTDKNPKLLHITDSNTKQQAPWKTVLSFLNNANFLKFLLYSGFWSFAVNISAPFFNLYLLDNLAIDVSVVTIYNSLGAGANLLTQMFWGKLADRAGNRPLMIVVGVLVALTPLLWLESGNTAIFLWFWFPLLFIIGGVTWAAIDLCSGNLLMSVAPSHQSIYFAIAAAVPGITGAIGITLGGFLTTLPNFGGITGLFALSAVLRLLALLPLVFVQEHRSVSLAKFWQLLLPTWGRKAPNELVEIS